MTIRNSADRARFEARIRASTACLSGQIAAEATKLRRCLETALQPSRLSRPELDFALRHALAGYKIAGCIRGEILNVVEAAVECGLGEPAAQKDALRHYWLTRERSAGGISLTDRVSDPVLTAAMYRIIRNAVESGYKLSDAAARLSNAGINRGDVPAATANLLCRIRQVAAAARRPETAVDFAKTVRQRLREIGRLADPGVTKLRQAYGEIADLCAGWSRLRLQQAVNYAANDLPWSNATRILNTEGARAYGMARRAFATKQPGIAGLRVKS